MAGSLDQSPRRRGRGRGSGKGGGEVARQVEAIESRCHGGRGRGDGGSLNRGRGQARRDDHSGQKERGRSSFPRRITGSGGPDGRGTVDLGDPRWAVILRHKPHHISLDAMLNMLPKNLWGSTIECPNAAKLGRGIPMDPRDFDPPLTMVYQKAIDQRLWIGGRGAANNLNILRAHGIRSKICCDGTLNNITFAKHGVKEWEAVSVNYCLHKKAAHTGPLREVDERDLLAIYDMRQVAETAEWIWGPAGLEREGDILLYCSYGSDRSAAMALAVIMHGTRRPAEQVQFQVRHCICNFISFHWH